MARAFTPSRSMLYGAPERQALIGIGDTLVGALKGWGEEQFQADYAEGMSLGKIAFARERNAIMGKMTTEKIRQPEVWVPTLRQSEAEISKKVMAGIRNPVAQKDLQNHIRKEFADLEIDLSNAAIKQQAVNRQMNYEARVESIKTESWDYGGPMGLEMMLKNVEDAIEFVAESSSGVPAHPDVATPEGADLERRKLIRGIVGDYAVQRAVATGDESAIEEVNQFGLLLLGQEDKPLFGPEELGDLTKRYKQISGAAKTEAERLRSDRAAAREKEMTIRLHRREFTMPNEKGELVNIWDVIQNEPDFSAEQIRTLSNLYTKQSAEPKAVTSLERNNSYRALSKETTRYENGEITYDRWRRVYEAHWQNTDEEDWESFWDRAQAVGRKPSDPKEKEIDAALDDTDKMATKTLASLIKDEKGIFYDPEGTTPEPPELAEAASEVLVHMRDWVKAQADKPFDPDAFRLERNRYLGEVYRRLYEASHAPKGKKKAKGGYTIGMEVTGRDGAKYEVVKVDENGVPRFRKKP